jgi:hypothetical protein
MTALKGDVDLCDANNTTVTSLQPRVGVNDEDGNRSKNVQ